MTLLARYRPGEGTAWYLTDRLGTVRDIVDTAGVLINHIDYDSFGQIILETNAAAGDRFKFTGREFDAETGLYYYRARYYDAGLGRFISQDPIGFDAGDANLYRYVGNAPTNGTDPFGLTALSEYNTLQSEDAKQAYVKAYAGCMSSVIFWNVAMGIVFQGPGPLITAADLAQCLVQARVAAKAATAVAGKTKSAVTIANQAKNRTQEIRKSIIGSLSKKGRSGSTIGAQADKRVGAALVREANKLPKNQAELAKELKKLGNRLIKRGKGGVHK